MNKIPPAFIGILVMCAAGLTLFAEYLGNPVLGAVGAVAVAFYIIAQWSELPVAGKALAIGAVLLIGVALATEDPLGLIIQGLERSVFMCTFLLFLGIIRAAADGSEIVRRCGSLLLSQKPGKRYTAFWTGGTLFGAIISIGSLSMFGPMINSANTLASVGGDERIRLIRAKRSMLALLRGFTSSLLWSPMSISLAIVLQALPGARWPYVLSTGAVIALLQMSLGWFLDRLAYPRSAVTVAPPQSSESWMVFLYPTCLLLTIFAIGSGLESQFDITLATGVMTGAPLVTLLWLVVQGRQRPSVSTSAHVMRNLGRFVRETVPRYRMELTILSTAGFAGAIIAHFLEPQMISSALAWTGAPAFLVPAIVIGLIISGGLMGLNAIITVMILGSALPDPTSFGVAPVVLATSYLAAWGMTVGSSPVAMSTLTIGNLNNVSGATVGLVWNRAYTLSCYLLSSVVLGLAVHFGAFL
ncbi:MAG: hypothetical protein HOE62_16075 [Alphaproteobacteria bacterium]|jgi:hypothetical protein|nr:hypothetical protein [Alphaproteobacteria bacterium]MBT4967293.1 hypothetical protein [Alphaproteobacteria bacterium]MBT5160464.1 hypothetical protein [Alphaproteobacteria bacterium]MBT6387938.1 hypothetical protein [Alphaproteobacteria bacterium]